MENIRRFRIHFRVKDNPSVILESVIVESITDGHRVIEKAKKKVLKEIGFKFNSSKHLVSCDEIVVNKR